jgi:predicted dehydrogenase
MTTPMGDEARGDLRLAVVGCGAAAEVHLMVLDRLGMEAACRVDKEVSRAEGLRDRYGAAGVATEARDLVGRVDAAVLSLPHHLHAPVAVELMEGGLDVLVEKPMAMTVAECDRMTEAAERTGRILAVGMARRFYRAGRFVKRAIEQGRIGEIRTLDVREGYVYDWPVASEFMFRREAGGGVLADAGAHVLDNLLWWLGDFERVDYRDDARGGVGADCEIELVMARGTRCFVELSRTRRLRNTWILEGSGGTLEIDTLFNPLVRWRFDGEPERLEGRVQVPGEPEEEGLDCFVHQMRDFLDAVAVRREPVVPGREGRRFVELLEACEANRQLLEHPWD